MEALHKSLNPCHVFRQTPHEDVIVIGAWDFEKGFVWGFTGFVEGLAVRKGDNVVFFCMDDQGGFVKGLDLVNIAKTLLLFISHGLCVDTQKL